MGGKSRIATTFLALTMSAVVLSFTALPAQASTASDESSFVSKINYERTSRGKGSLAVYSDLVSVARAHSRDMAAKGTIWHADDTPYKISGWTVYGENVGMGGSVDDLHKAFMASPEHRDNILDPAFNEVGVGVAMSGSTMYVTEIFVKRSSGTVSHVSPPASQPAPASSAPAFTQNSFTPNPVARKPVARKPVVPTSPRNVSVLTELVGLDATDVDPATGRAAVRF